MECEFIFHIIEKQTECLQMILHDGLKSVKPT